jgi:SAM-dependent methyltransferase
MTNGDNTNNDISGVSQTLYFDTNNISFLDTAPPCGRLAALGRQGRNILFKGGLTSTLAADDAILAVDEYKRFLFAAPAKAIFELAVRIDVFKMTTDTPARLYLYNTYSNEAIPLTFPKILQEKLSRLLLEAMPNFRPTVIPTYIDKFVEIVINTMNSEKYTSVSSHEGIKTGNNYQAVHFGTLLKSGGRPARDAFLRSVDLRDKTVIDLGCNTGEMSRIARRHGASLVDGFEYDKFFVETARLINAVTGVTRVSVFQADITDQRFYKGRKYDIIFAFSVFVYLRKVLSHLPDIADCMILETHTLDHGLGMYIDPIIEHFPSFQMLGISDANKNPSKSRVLIAFGTSEEALKRNISLNKIVANDYFPNRFFSQYGKTDPSALHQYIDSIYNSVKDALDQIQINAGLGVNYFIVYLLGYREYIRNNRVVTDDNIFLVRFLDAVKKGAIDPQLTYLLNDVSIALKKIEMKFVDIDLAVAGQWNQIHPPRLTLSQEGKLVFTRQDGETLNCINIDGHHRYFLAQLLSRPYVDCLVIDPTRHIRRVVKGSYHLDQES